MLCTIPAKLLVASWETAMYKRGVKVRRIRKLGALAAAAISAPAGLAFVAMRRPALATICYCLFVTGQVRSPHACTHIS